MKTLGAFLVAVFAVHAAAAPTPQPDQTPEAPTQDPATVSHNIAGIDPDAIYYKRRGRITYVAPADHGLKHSSVREVDESKRLFDAELADLRSYWPIAPPPKRSAGELETAPHEFEAEGRNLRSYWPIAPPPKREAGDKAEYQ